MRSPIQLFPMETKGIKAQNDPQVLPLRDLRGLAQVGCPQGGSEEDCHYSNSILV